MDIVERCHGVAVFGAAEEIAVERSRPAHAEALSILRFVSILIIHLPDPINREDRKLIMFHPCSANQYKRQFGIWNLKRVLPTAKKEKISKLLETRAQQGKLSVVLHKGKVEVQKIRRYMKEQARLDISIFANKSNEDVAVENLSGHALQCGNRV
jgi:hypothetical protein